MRTYFDRFKQVWSDRRRMIGGGAILATLLALALFLVFTSATAATIPTFTIGNVAVDQSVTIHTSNFPANQNFTVTMGPMGTRGVNGIVVGTTNSGNGGSFTATYTIPERLRGARQIAIRLQSPQGYFSYNWFYNNTVSTQPIPGPGTGSPGYTGIPTFSIEAVQTDNSVTIRTNNFPRSQTFTVRMGAMGTRGVNGTVVGTLDSGAGGALTATFTIPANLRGARQIAIRADAPPYFAYNWFNNASTAPVPPPAPPPAPPPGYTGIPSFSICGVARNQSATIRTNNFPPNQTFTVTMGAMGTQGIGGTAVGTIDTGAGGAGTYTFNIPANLQNASRIAIRAQSGGVLPYFAYNWFYNNTATVC